MTRLALVIVASTTVSLAVMSAAGAQQVTADVNRISDKGLGEKIGTITITEAKKGVSFKVTVKGLPPGKRGFHLHENGNCGPATKDGKMVAGLAAGSHFDPEGKKSHRGPMGAGHKGDLPALNGTAKGINQTVTAPRLKLAEVRGRALVIHEGGDNYTDKPENGGGKGRVACAVVPKQ
jgi:Cu-Zn family superoxide dismutase